MNDQLQLKTSHILLDSELVATLFGEVLYAYVSFVKEKGMIYITPASSIWFVKMYEPTQFLLKARNLSGDRSLAIREILIDNDICTDDRILEYEVVERTKLIKVSIA